MERERGPTLFIIFIIFISVFGIVLFRRAQVTRERREEERLQRVHLAHHTTLRKTRHPMSRKTIRLFLLV